MAIGQRSTRPGPGNAAPAAKAATPAAATAPAKATASESIIKVQTTMLEGGTIKGEPVVKEARQVHVFQTAHATAGIKLGFNRNLQNMEMAKVEVFVSMPCYVEEFESAKGQVMDVGKRWLDEAINELGVENYAAGTTEEGADPTAEVSGEAGDEPEVDEDYIKAADRETLEKICTDYATELGGIDPADFPEDDELREAVLEAYAAIGTEGAAEGEAATEATAAYTQDELEAAEDGDLKEIFANWQLGEYPKGPPKAAKKSAIKKILAAQEAQGPEAE